MYFNRKVYCLTIGGVIIGLCCELFSEKQHTINKEHVHTDCSHLASMFKPRPMGALIASAPSGNYGLMY